MDRARTLAPHVARVLLGLSFFVFGLNGFLGFIPLPPHPGPGGELLGAFAAAGYMFPLIKGTELVAGLLLLSNRFTALALVLLAPVLVNIVLFHLVLDGGAGIGLPLFLVALEIGLAWSYRETFAPILKAVVTPARSEPAKPAPALATA
jgi:hypothetical protein